MLPAPIWPLAEHVSFGQNWCDASIGSVVLFILHSMPLDACFFQALLTFSPVSVALPVRSLGPGTLTRCAHHIQSRVDDLYQAVVYERGGES